LEALLEEPELPYEIVTRKLNITSVVIRTLEEAGIIEVQREQDWRNPIHILEQEVKRDAGIVLNQNQQQVVDGIWQDFIRGKCGTYLIHGVTGSGKTAVYIELIEQAVRMGKQAIVLIPEIALTYQTVMRFYGKFGNRVSILNSRMSAGERFDQMERVKRGEVDVMIGPRSALFTPFSNLGLIIIDEEHETTYKSEQVPRYHARATAIARANIEGASVVLGSATPSLEAFYRCTTGEYELLQLSNKKSFSFSFPFC
jgi:primosomal protein N' (replication factor Y)